MPEINLPDASAVEGDVARVLADEIYWFPVRHHSPTVAKHVEAAIQERRPEVVFIEGPSEANDLVRHVVDRKTRPPVAIYSSYRDDDNVLGLAGVQSPSPEVPARFAIWFPLMAYSPELVAMRAAAKIGAEVVLIDLPHYALIDREGPQPWFSENRFYQILAESAGFRSWDEAWDSLFELGPYSEDRERFRRELATFCAAARATAEPARIESDGTRPRERFMWRTIRETLSRKKLASSKAMVVCGGFHLFLDRDDDTPPPEAPSGTVATALVPYSFFRVSELSGYAAGNRAPQYYQSLWELSRKGETDGLLPKHVVQTLKRARREGEPVSSADAISISQHARLLGALRGRAVPVLEDIHDAVMSCCCKGDPDQEGLYLRRAMDAVAIGTKVGAVTPAVGRLPLVNDFYAQIESAGFEEMVGNEKRITVQLDKREESDQQRSALLHRLRFLTIPVCVLAEGGGQDLSTGTIFREVWKLAWSPSAEPELIEKNLYGDTLEAASLAVLEEKLAHHHHDAAATCARLREAVAMDLPTLAATIEASAREAIEQDGRFVSLSDALHHLAVLDRDAMYRRWKREVLSDLIERAFDRACFALPEAANAPEDEQEHVVNALRVLAEALLGDDGALDSDLFVQHVQSAAGVSRVPFLQGAFTGMLTELRAIPPEESSAALARFATEPPERMVFAGDYLDGMLASGRASVLLGGDTLVRAIDELVRAADWDSFLVMLPRLRAAFERLHARQRDTLADRVARHYGLTSGEDLTELRTSVAAAALFAEIDAEVARVMKDWRL